MARRGGGGWSFCDAPPEGLAKLDPPVTLANFKLLAFHSIFV
jgi:hypothetical protein